MAYSLKNEEDIVVSCIKNKKTILEKNAYQNPNIDKNFVVMIGANEFVCVPLVVKGEWKQTHDTTLRGQIDWWKQDS